MAYQNDFYQDLRVRVKEWLTTEDGKTNKWSEYVMLAPDLLHLLIKLSMDSDVPAVQKAKLAGAIAYFVSPIDLIPEALLGPVGFADDIAMAAWVLNSIVNETNPEIIRKHWAGEEEVLEVIQKIINAADSMVGSGLWQKIKRKFG
ncbi:MAG: YkvA family protein [Chitinophagales bacterium]